MKWLSRKLFVTLASNVIALYLAFGGAISPEQSTAVITFINTAYLIVNAYDNRGKMKYGNGVG